MRQHARSRTRESAKSDDFGYSRIAHRHFGFCTIRGTTSPLATINLNIFTGRVQAAFFAEPIHDFAHMRKELIRGLWMHGRETSVPTASMAKEKIHHMTHALFADRTQIRGEVHAAGKDAGNNLIGREIKNVWQFL